AARYGGEEFGVILTHTEAEGAATAAERLLSAVRAYRMPHRVSPVAPHVTVSVGLATMIPQEGMAPAELIRRADFALYQAKEEGRNRLAVSMNDSESINVPGTI